MEQCPEKKAPIEVTEDKKSFKNLLLKFMSYTSAHGIGRLGESKTIFWKIFWSLVCLGAFGMFIFQLIGLFKLYLSRPVSTSVKITFEKQLPFPAVTVCNLNMIRKDAMPSSVKKTLERERPMYDGADTGPKGTSPAGSGSGYDSPPEKAPNPSPTFVIPVPSASPTHRIRRAVTDEPYSLPTLAPSPKTNYDDDSFKDYYDTYQDYSYPYDKEDKEDIEEDYPDPVSVDPETRFRQELALLIGQLDEGDLYYSGHSFESLIVNCSWKGIDCTTGNFSKYWTHSWNYKYGNCHTFNSGMDYETGEKVRILKASKPGPSQGLKLTVDIQQSQYIGPITIEAGVRVLLHDQGVMPFPYEEGFSIGPSMATSIGIKKTKIIRLDRFNNKSCWSDNELSKENIYRRFKNVTRYSQQACLNSCLGLSQWFQCNCSENAYPSSGKPCDPSVSKTRSCLRKVRFLFNNDRLKCITECRQPCTEEIIQKTISASQWPSKAYQTYLISQGGSRNQSDSDLLLNVFYNELNYEKIEEEFSYGDINLLADIGGQLGLWIGISVITCCELLELFMKFFSHIIKKCNSASQAIEQGIPPYGD